MSKTRIPASMRRLVEERAGYRCEFCLVPIDITFFPHEIDHIIAEKHQGKTESENLALVCWRCNRHKGSDLGSFDPETQGFCFLFKNAAVYIQNKLSLCFRSRSSSDVEGLSNQVLTPYRNRCL